MPTDEEIANALSNYYNDLSTTKECTLVLRAMFDQPVRSELYEAMEDARRLLGCDRSHRSLRDAILRLQDDLAKAKAGQLEPKADAPRMSARLAIAMRIMAAWIRAGHIQGYVPDIWRQALKMADDGISAERETR